MSLAEKLRAYLAERSPTWTDDATATWTEAGSPRLLVAIGDPLTADALVDAHVRALAQGARLTIAHAGPPTAVALRMAALFGITLLDASTFPEPEAAVAPIERAWADATDAFDATPIASPDAPDFPAPPPGFFRALERPVAQLPDVAEAFAAFDALATPGDPTPVVAPPAILDVPAVPPPGVELPEVVPELLVAASAPDPIVAHEDPGMPWDLSLGAPEPEPVHVEAAELAAMPWNLHPEQHELLPAGREARFAPARPSAMAQDWGLPWPRPLAPTGGLSIQDPRVWHAQERIEAVREDLNRIGAPSFGAAKPEGSSWLKRLSEFP